MHLNISYERFCCFEKSRHRYVHDPRSSLLGDMDFFWDITEGGQNKRGHNG